MKIKICFYLLTVIFLPICAIKRKSHEFIPVSRFTLRDIKNNTDKPAYMVMHKVGTSHAPGIRQDIEIPAKETLSLLEPLVLKEISDNMVQTQKIEIASYYDLDTEVPEIVVLNVTKEEHIQANNPQRRSLQVKANLISIDPMNDQELDILSTVTKDYLLLGLQRDYYFIDIILSGKDLQGSTISVTQQVK